MAIATGVWMLNTLGVLRAPRLSPPGSFSYARNGNRSLMTSMNQRKYEAWSQFTYDRVTAFDVALRLLERPFSRKDLPGGGRYGFHQTPDLLRARLLPSANILPFAAPATRHRPAYVMAHCIHPFIARKR